MFIEEYIKESERTLSDGFHFITETVQRQLHAAIGINTEITEIFQAIERRRMDTTNILEEIADIHWYLAIFQREFGFVANVSSLDANALGFNSLKDLIVDTQVQAGELLDLYKKKGFYNAVISQDQIIPFIHRISLNTVVMCEWLGIPLEVGLQRNIDKLKARFPDKFTEHFAQVRDLDTERKILEGRND